MNNLQIFFEHRTEHSKMDDALNPYISLSLDVRSTVYVRLYVASLPRASASGNGCSRKRGIRCPHFAQNQCFLSGARVQIPSFTLYG